MWKEFISPGAAAYLPIDTTAESGTSAILSQDQAIYISKMTSKYELFNPTNYDMHVVIYDIICKEDTDKSVISANVNYQNIYNSSDSIKREGFNSDCDNPMSLFYRGTQNVPGTYAPIDSNSYNPNTRTLVGSGYRGTDVFDIDFKPSSSYPFNMYWTIVKKRAFKLQPGATMHHKFVYRPKNLMNRDIGHTNIQRVLIVNLNNIED